MIEVTFRNLGRNKAKFSVMMPELTYARLLAAVRPHLASREIDFSTEDDIREGHVHAGFHTVGEFTWTQEMPSPVSKPT